MSHGPLQFAGFTFDPRARELRRGSRSLSLRPKVNRLLRLLASRAGETVDRESIRRALWGDKTVVEFDMGISSCVRELRQALEELETGGSALIATVPTEGYRLDAQVGTVAPPKGWRGFLLLAVGALLATLLAWVAFRWSGEADGQRMVILPIRDLSGSTIETVYLDSVFEDVLLRLGPLNPARLGIVPGMSARQLDTTALSAREIGRRLDAHWVLESTARTVEGHLLLTLSLVDAGREVMLWGEILEFDQARPPSGEVADRIADLVADAAGVSSAPLPVEPTALEAQSREEPPP